MQVKVHEVEKQGFKEIVVTLCDNDVLGTHLGNDFFVNPRFYSGQEMSDEKALDAVAGASVVNAVGENSVGLLIKVGLVKEDETVRIGGVPHAQVFVIKEL